MGSAILVALETGQQPLDPVDQARVLDHFIVFGERHLRYLVNEYIDYYHRQRPHQGLSNEPLHGLQLIDDPDQPDDASRV